MNGPFLSSDNRRVTSATSPYRSPSEHYENFPVASWFCPPALRPPIAAIYWFARTADDIADEGQASAAARLDDLAQYRDDLQRTVQGRPPSDRWPGVFQPLAPILRAFDLPVALLANLLDAFEQDVAYTDAGRRYRTDDELLAYCRLSANPVGRLLLHLYGVRDSASVEQSDRICTALQLINFWQDLRTDIARARWYPSVEQMTRHAVDEADLLRDANHAAASRMVAHYAGAAGHMMRQGAPLALRLPGRAGWELRLVVQGGLRILEKMALMNHATWLARPKLGKRDLPLMLWRACWPVAPQAEAQAP